LTKNAPKILEMAPGENRATEERAQRAAPLHVNAKLQLLAGELGTGRSKRVKESAGLGRPPLQKRSGERRRDPGAAKGRVLRNPASDWRAALLQVNAKPQVLESEPGAAGALWVRGQDAGNAP